MDSRFEEKKNRLMLQNHEIFQDSTIKIKNHPFKSTHRVYKHNKVNLIKVEKILSRKKHHLTKWQIKI